MNALLICGVDTLASTITLKLGKIGVEVSELYSKGRHCARGIPDGGDVDFVLFLMNTFAPVEKADPVLAAAKRKGIPVVKCGTHKWSVVSKALERVMPATHRMTGLPAVTAEPEPKAVRKRTAPPWTCFGCADENFAEDTHCGTCGVERGHNPRAARAAAAAPSPLPATPPPKETRTMTRPELPTAEPIANEDRVQGVLDTMDAWLDLGEDMRDALLSKRAEILSDIETARRNLQKIDLVLKAIGEAPEGTTQDPSVTQHRIDYMRCEAAVKAVLAKHPNGLKLHPLCEYAHEHDLGLDGYDLRQTVNRMKTNRTLYTMGTRGAYVYKVAS